MWYERKINTLGVLITKRKRDMISLCRIKYCVLAITEWIVYDVQVTLIEFGRITDGVTIKH